MSPPVEPSAEPAETPAQIGVVPTELLDDGEVILLATKPSGWFALLVSGPVLGGAALVAAGMLLAGPAVRIGARARQGVVLICLAAACLRVVLACCQWFGRLYILTDRRILRIRGIIRSDVFACPLRDIRRTTASAGLCERLLGLASLYFDLEDGEGSDSAWIHLSHPEEIRQTIEEAIRRAR